MIVAVKYKLKKNRKIKELLIEKLSNNLFD